MLRQDEGKLLMFPASKDGNLLALKEISDEIDRLVINGLKSGVPGVEVAGLLAHRLGSLIFSLGSQPELQDACKKIMKRQANGE